MWMTINLILNGDNLERKSQGITSLLSESPADGPSYICKPSRSYSYISSWMDGWMNEGWWLGSLGSTCGPSSPTYNETWITMVNSSSYCLNKIFCEQFCIRKRLRRYNQSNEIDKFHFLFTSQRQVTNMISII